MIGGRNIESGPSTIGQVQAYFHQSYGTTSKLITQLEKASYVTQTWSQADNRVVIVELTPVGRDIAKNSPLRGLTFLRRRLSRLTEAKLLQINEVSSEIMQHMKPTNIETGLLIWIGYFNIGS